MFFYFLFGDEPSKPWEGGVGCGAILSLSTTDGRVCEGPPLVVSGANVSEWHGGVFFFGVIWKEFSFWTFPVFSQVDGTYTKNHVLFWSFWKIRGSKGGRAGMGEISIPSKMWRILCNVFFVFGVNLWQVYIFFSLEVHFVWVGQKLALAKQRFPFFLGGWVFFFNQHSSCDSMWSPNKNPWQKRLTGRELLCLPFRRNKSLRSGQQNTLWLSVITALSGSLRWWTAQGMQQDWCEFGMRNIARCYAKCRREWPVALPSLPWEWGEKDGGALGEGVVVLPTTWWFPMNVPLSLVGFENSPVLGFELICFLHKSFGYWDGGPEPPRPKPWTLHHLGRALVEVQVEE